MGKINLRLMRLRTADVAANVCIRDERGAVVDPKQPSHFHKADAQQVKLPGAVASGVTRAITAQRPIIELPRRRAPAGWAES